MITVKLKDYTLEVKGHAFFAEPGQDIVCAAASILTFTLIETLARLKARGALESNSVEAKGDSITVKCKPRPGLGNISALVSYDTVMTGYQLLADKYPEHLEISA